MRRTSVFVALCCVLFLQPGASAKARATVAAPPGQETTPHQPTLKEKLLEIAPGSLVEVRLRNKAKVRGQLCEISDEGFNLQLVRKDKVETQKVAFSEVKAVRQIHNSSGKAAGRNIGWAAVGVGIGIGVMLLIVAR